MRIRSIKPSYWTDVELQTGLTADEREFYIGLWMLADDAGWLTWNPVTIGAELYPFRQRSRREAQIIRWAQRLATADPEHPHLIIYDCGHAQVPKIARHQHPGRPVYTVQTAHRNCAQLNAVERSESQPRRVEERRVEEGRGEESKGGDRRGIFTPMRAALLEAGVDPKLVQ